MKNLLILLTYEYADSFWDRPIRPLRHISADARPESRLRLIDAAGH